MAEITAMCKTPDGTMIVRGERAGAETYIKLVLGAYPCDAIPVGNSVALSTYARVPDSDDGKIFVKTPSGNIREYKGDTFETPLI